jgi:hypothetical protein
VLATTVKVIVTGSPLWLSILPIFVSFVAVAIAMWQGGLTARGQRFERPNVSGTVGYYRQVVSNGPEPAPAFIVSLSNKGSQPTAVEGIFIGTDNKALNGQNALIDGPVIPFRLEGNTSQTWIVDAALFATDDDRVHVRVTLGHGPLLHSIVERDAESAELRSLRRQPETWLLGPRNGKGRHRFRIK